MKNYIKQHVKTCPTCQLCKMPRNNQGKLKIKNNMDSAKPWNRVCTDTIGPWEISITEYAKGKSGRRKKIRTKIVTIYALTIIGELTSWPEITRIAGKTSYETSRAFDKE